MAYFDKSRTFVEKYIEKKPWGFMAGHSQFKNIMHRKEAQDGKRAKLFTRLLREITVAAKSGDLDPLINHRLRTALAAARSANVPKNTIDRAVNKASDPHEQYEAIEYEAFGPHSSAFMIRVLTNNRNRSACDVRTALNRHGGRIGEAKFLFHQQGMVIYPVEKILSAEHFLAKALDLGAQDIMEDGGMCGAFCPKEELFTFKEALEAEFGPALFGAWVWNPDTVLVLEKEEEDSVEKLIQALENCDDVQEVSVNTLTPLRAYLLAHDVGE